MYNKMDDHSQSVPRMHDGKVESNTISCPDLTLFGAEVSSVRLAVGDLGWKRFSCVLIGCIFYGMIKLETGLYKVA